MTSCQKAAHAWLPAPLQRSLVDRVQVCDGINRAVDDASDDFVLINALADKMPECDARSARMSALEDVRHAERCAIYCAQPTCSAAIDFMNAHATELSKKCASIVYLHEGALHVRADRLVDGPTCHARIDAFNSSASW